MLSHAYSAEEGNRRSCGREVDPCAQALINTARGKVIDEAMIRALKDGHVSGLFIALGNVEC